MPNVSLHLQSLPENVGLAREALAGLAELLTLSRERYDDMRTAVTEACNNVVQHAYPDEAGPLEVTIDLDEGALEMMVRDSGVGMARAAKRAGDLEIGLPVMQALCEQLQVDHPPEGGTALRMRFGVPGLKAAEGSCGRGQVDLGASHGAMPTVRAAFSSGELAGAILPRLATALAVRAHFGTNGVSDVQLLSDVLARSAAPLAHGGCLSVGMTGELGRLDIQVGLFDPSCVERLLGEVSVAGRAQTAGAAPARSRSILRQLAQERSAVWVGQRQMLLLGVRDRGRD